MNAPRLWPRIAPSLWVFACALATAVGLAFALIGSDLTSRQFLQNYREPNLVEASLALAAEYSEQSPGASEIVFFGDSTAECSLDPIQFEHSSGLKAVNFGTGGIVGIEGFTVVLRRYLEHHPRPRAIVFSMHPHALGVPDSHFGPTRIRNRFLRCYGGAGVVSLLKAICKDLLTPEHSSATCKSLVRHAMSGLGNLAGKCRGMTPEQHFDEIVPTWSHWPTLTYNRFRSILRERRGFVANAGAMSPGDRWPHSVEFPVREEHKQAMRNLIALANRYSMPLIVRLTPVMTMPDEARWDEMRDWLAQLERENPGVVVSRPELIEYPPECYMDEMHLNTRGAEKFTAFVAGDMRRILAARRPNVSESADRNGL